MALSNKKFLDEAGLVKLIGLIKRGISQATATTVQTVGIASEEDTSHYANINIVPNHPRTGNYVTTDGTQKTFTYYDTHYGVAEPNTSDDDGISSVAGRDGLMSRADKTKLDGIAAGANKTVVDTAMSTTSTNPVQNKVVDTAIKAAAKTVRQTSQNGTTALPLLVSAQGSPTNGNNYEAGYDTDLKFTPSSNTLVVKSATSSASGVTITPTSIKVGTTATGGAAEMTPTQINVGTGTLTATAYSGKATQTETDLADSGEGKGASMVAYDGTHTVKDKIDALDSAVGGGNLVGSITGEAKGAQEPDENARAEFVERTGTYTMADGTTTNGFKYLTIKYGAAQAPTYSGTAPTISVSGGKMGLMTAYEKENLAKLVAASGASTDGSTVPSVVKGVKGNAETSYRTGNVNLTPANIGALPSTAKVNGQSFTNGACKVMSGNIELTTNISVDGTDTGSVQAALVALNTLAASNKSAIGALKTIEFKIVTSLPTVANGETNIIYLIAHTHTTADSNTATGTSNAYDEYIKVNKGTDAKPTWAWEKIGSTDIDLSNYWNGTNLTALSESDVESLWTSTNAAASAA